MSKQIKSFLILLFVFVISLENINAYEFEDPSNENRVNSLIRDIYDAKQQYEDLVGDYTENRVQIQTATSSAYWWPIGSEKTTNVGGKDYAKGMPVDTHITSDYGYREGPLGGGTQFHSGIDISGPYSNGVVNVVAVKEGVVVYPTASHPTSCPISNNLSACGGGYGNYVIIQHSDGNYSLYAHLHENTITVTAGDSVEQGQVIGKMGTSGNSTGTHLHFEIREGQNASNATVDPLLYVSLEQPRVIFTGNEFITWLSSWEGHTKIEGDYYVVEDIGDGVRTVGAGVTLENNPQLFSKYGIDINEYPTGSKIKISIVDQMKLEITSSKRSSIEGILASNSLVLQENQIQALISQMYNTGNIVGFVDYYKRYGNTQEFYDNWFFRNVMKGTQFEVGLTRRRNAEWALFNLGKYVYNG